jgi:hypothetical protein
MIDVVTELERLGYELALDVDAIRARYTGDGDPPTQAARSLFAQLAAGKGEALDVLSRRFAISSPKVAATPATVQRLTIPTDNQEPDANSDDCNGDCNGATLLRRPLQCCTTVAMPDGRTESDDTDTVDKRCSVAPLQGILREDDDTTSTIAPPFLVDYPRLVCPECNADGYRMGDVLTPPPGRERWECPRCRVGWAVPIATVPEMSAGMAP